MVTNIIIIVFAVCALAILINGVEDYCRQKKCINMSFKEAMDLVELPIVTFTNNGKKLNFLLDTGSNISQINSSVLPYLKYKIVEDKNSAIIGIEGNKIDTQFCEMAVTYKEQDFINEFCIHDLTDAFAIIKEESGVQVHGILGSLFFQKYKYILDFKTLIAYYKK